MGSFENARTSAGTHSRHDNGRVAPSDIDMPSRPVREGESRDIPLANQELTNQELSLTLSLAATLSLASSQ
jgi:hypothetical protein